MRNKLSKLMIVPYQVQLWFFQQTRGKSVLFIYQRNKFFYRHSHWINFPAQLNRGGCQCFHNFNQWRITQNQDIDVAECALRSPGH